MALVVTDDKHYKDIADAIRNGAPDGHHMKALDFKPSEMPAAVELACSESEDAGYWMGYGDGERNGYSDGFQEGYDDGFTVGEQTEYDRFWNAYQQNGSRTDYQRAFSGPCWNAETLHPKYNIAPKWGGATAMFQGNMFPGSLKQHFESIGKSLDFSALSSATNIFYGASTITELPDLDFGSCKEFSSVFVGCTSLHTLKIKVSETMPFSSGFTNCSALVNFTIEGTVGQNGLNLQWSTKLSKTSIESVVNALSTTTSGLSVTLSKTAVNTAFATEEWATLAATKSNWTINLV